MSPSKVVNARDRFRAADERLASIASGGGGGDNNAMEARVRALEQNMTDVRERLARIEMRLEQTATKSDLVDVYKAINAQTWRLIGAVTALVVAVTFIVRNLPPAA